jgi:hypothetical protein
VFDSQTNDYLQVNKSLESCGNAVEVPSSQTLSYKWSN